LGSKAVDDAAKLRTALVSMVQQLSDGADASTTSKRITDQSGLTCTIGPRRSAETCACDPGERGVWGRARNLRFLTPWDSKPSEIDKTSRTEPGALRISHAGLAEALGGALSRPTPQAPKAPEDSPVARLLADPSHTVSTVQYPRTSARNFIVRELAGSWGRRLSAGSSASSGSHPGARSHWAIVHRSAPLRAQYSTQVHTQRDSLSSVPRVLCVRHRPCVRAPCGHRQLDRRLSGTLVSHSTY
jgi:hypothetical protein